MNRSERLSPLVRSDLFMFNNKYAWRLLCAAAVRCRAAAVRRHNQYAYVVYMCPGISR